MAQTIILAPGNTAALSTDVVVEAGKVATIGVYSDLYVDDAKFNSISLLMVTPGGDNKIDVLSNTKRAVIVTGPGTFRVQRQDYQGDAFGAFVEV